MLLPCFWFDGRPCGLRLEVRLSVQQILQKPLRPYLLLGILDLPVLDHAHELLVPPLLLGSQVITVKHYTIIDMCDEFIIGANVTRGPLLFPTVLELLTRGVVA